MRSGNSSDFMKIENHYYQAKPKPRHLRLRLLPNKQGEKKSKKIDILI